MRILSLIQRGYDFNMFFSDKKTQDAVVRNLEIIGEAVKNLSEKLKGNMQMWNGTK